MGRPIEVKGLFDPTSGKAVYLPMSTNDLITAYKEYGVDSQTAVSLLSLFGIGTQTYETPTEEKLGDLPGTPNAQLEKVLASYDQFIADHPEIRTTAVSTGTEQQELKKTVMRRAEELIRRGIDPTELLRKEVVVDPERPVQIGSSFSNRRRLSDFTPSQLSALQNSMLQGDYEQLENYDDLLSAYGKWYGMFDRIGQGLGTHIQLQHLKAPSSEQLKGLQALSKAERIQRTKENEVHSQIRKPRPSVSPASSNPRRT